ncbi:hypothetical protein DM860_004567 [Cuscuta australis]|uniref:Uncharacterized protein n=1 Tax=Cuscuta australis TaxID=267555 RepID=A0A328E9S6_9ASTE|nr:hypothetical protein DM860_004567 [Cuscuta australis]
MGSGPSRAGSGCGRFFEVNDSRTDWALRIQAVRVYQVPQHDGSMKILDIVFHDKEPQLPQPTSAHLCAAHRGPNLSPLLTAPAPPPPNAITNCFIFAIPILIFFFSHSPQ